MSAIETGLEAGARAAAHADRACGEPLWSKLAWVRFLEYLVILRRDVQRHATFTTEDFRDFAFTHSLPDPPDARAYGNVTRHAITKGLIVHSGKWVPSKNPQTHGRDVKLWLVA